MKLKYKFFILVSIMGFFGFLAAVTGMYAVRLQEQIGKEIELTKELKYLIQKSAFNVAVLKYQRSEVAEKNLKTNVEKINKLLEALKYNDAFKTESAWEKFLRTVLNIKPIITTQYKEQLDILKFQILNFEKLLKRNASIESIEKMEGRIDKQILFLENKLLADERRRLFYKFEFFYIVFGTLIFCVIGWYLRDVSYRIEKLTFAIKSIPTGKFCKLGHVPEKYKTDDEIGEAFKAVEETANIIFELLGKVKKVLQNFELGKVEKINTEGLEGKWKDIADLLNSISEKWEEAAKVTLRWIECFKALKSCETCERRFTCIVPADNKGVYKEIYGTLKRLKDETMVAAEEIERYRKEVSKAIREGKTYIPSSIDYSKIPEFLMHIAKALEDMAVYLINALSSQKIFLATVSHDIRTPLNGIIGFLNLLSQSKELSEKDKEYVELALSSAKQLLSLVNDVLDVAKIQAEQIELYSEPINIIKVVKDSARALSPNLKEGVELRFNFPKDELWVVADEKRVKQIFFNLISNAMKFTEKGYIEVGLKRIKDEGDTVKLLFYVKDTGIGIPYEKQPLLFRPFTQVKSHISRKAEGTGLGLFITKKLANIMGGDVWVDSVPGKGSTFYVLLTLKKAKAPAKEELKDKLECAEVDKNLKVLVAEDVLVNQILIRELLKKKFGIENVKIVDNGAKAVEEAEKGDYDVILMDLKMPVMDGLTAVKNIREKGIDVPIFILTADAFRDSEEKAMKAGADGYLVKPVNFDRLCKALTYATKIKREKNG